jgi:hypothetical protein
MTPCLLNFTEIYNYPLTILLAKQYIQPHILKNNIIYRLLRAVTDTRNANAVRAQLSLQVCYLYCYGNMTGLSIYKFIEIVYWVDLFIFLTYYSSMCNFTELYHNCYYHIHKKLAGLCSQLMFKRLCTESS